MTRLDSLTGYGDGRTVTLSVETADSGLRQGDPASVVFSEHVGGRLRDGLVLPVRIGEPVSLFLPRGDYSLAALGGRGTALLTSRDPYSALGGDTLTLDGPRRLVLPLSARVPQPRVCATCGRTLTSDGVCLNATVCRWCGLDLLSYEDCQAHERQEHWSVWRHAKDFFTGRY